MKKRDDLSGLKILLQRGFQPYGQIRMTVSPPNVKRDRLNRRIFDEHDIAWIKSLSCLKNCGMSIQEMKEYTKLCLDGVATIQQRKEILNIKKAQLEENIAALTALVE